jgi:SAM-dependent methyltransferase
LPLLGAAALQGEVGVVFAVWVFSPLGNKPTQTSSLQESNKGPILEVLRRRLPGLKLDAGGRVLEIASGTVRGCPAALSWRGSLQVTEPAHRPQPFAHPITQGQHIAHFAAALPGLEFTPTDLTADLFPSIAAHTAAAGAANVARPVVLDATWPPEQWRRALREGSGGVEPVFDAVVASNLTHISPWPATLGLLAGAAAVLRPGGLCAIYGPFQLRGAFTTASNRAFHEHLVAR